MCRLSKGEAAQGSSVSSGGGQVRRRARTRARQRRAADRAARLGSATPVFVGPGCRTASFALRLPAARRAAGASGARGRTRPQAVYRAPSHAVAGPACFTAAPRPPATGGGANASSRMTDAPVRPARCAHALPHLAAPLSPLPAGLNVFALCPATPATAPFHHAGHDAAVGGAGAAHSLGRCRGRRQCACRQHGRSRF